MAALRRLITGNPKHSSLIPPTLLIFRRGIASKLFVGGLSFYTTEKGLLDAFSQYGQVMEDEAEKAITQMDGRALNGRVIFVDYAKPTSNLGGSPIARGPPDPITKN
ncbi:PREDICTED: cold-inducible RNA-binding protein isoform X2 [Theobroma cacao]|uniref:Cold-inducible RNA-binding protein isoform X2 n=1 Tax=Theobroma cacao TaxID=3641 RepID=A0AB32WA44_THECC|nr:PREDICTED: cold-inducible RNA-binding protein isoform X2 [Theobroma cacao]XP_017976267.1 PREDICTED: cold-inducible RNA-binding protein isoform X2 [Theobroma cacao]